MAKEYKDLVVGLDIGTAKVMAVVAEVLPGGELKLAGLGIAPSNGLKRGVVVNIDATVQSIQQALKEAELMADCKITRVYTGITGSHIRGINSSGMVAIKDREVTAADVARVVETAKAINISTDQRLLLVEPQEFIIDGQDVKEPIGMSGIRLEARVHIVTGAQSAAENIIKCVRRCGLEVEQLMLNPLASSLSVLTEDERELGVALVDIGAGTTDVAIFTNGAIRHTAVIPIAGDLITSDIAMALRTPTKDAEDIKVESGFAKQLLADPDSQVEVPGLGDRGPRMLSRQALAGVIEPRVEEIFSLVHQVMRESGFEEMLSSGIVLTGGSCIMPGMVELGEDIFLKPVRRGIPKYSSALSDMVAQPRAATVMGSARRSPHGPFARLQGGAKKWLHENSFWPGQRLVCGELLMKNTATKSTGPPVWLVRASPHGRWRGMDPPCCCAQTKNTRKSTTVND
jgi:cell division protein FtsA